MVADLEEIRIILQEDLCSHPSEQGWWFELGCLRWKRGGGRWIDRRDLQVSGWMPFRHGLGIVVGEGDVTYVSGSGRRWLDS